MGKLQQQLGNLNDSDALRALLHECERALASLKADASQDVLQGTSREASHDLLSNLEDAHQRLERLDALGADMRPERSRLETLDDRIVKNANPIVKALGGSNQFAELRQQLNPNSNELRWQLDAVIVQAQRKTLKQIGIVVGVLAAVLFAGWLARPILFPPDPAGDAIRAAQESLTKNDLTGAVTAVNLTLTEMPTDTQLLIWQGALLELQYQSSSGASFDRARTLMPERDFLLERAQVYYGLSQFAKAVADMDALLAKQPNSAEAYYVRGGAYEGLKNKAKAIEDITKAADLAQAQGNDTLYATARVRMGMMMQAQ